MAKKIRFGVHFWSFFGTFCANTDGFWYKLGSFLGLASPTPYAYTLLYGDHIHSKVAEILTTNAFDYTPQSLYQTKMSGCSYHHRTNACCPFRISQIVLRAGYPRLNDF